VLGTETKSTCTPASHTICTRNEQVDEGTKLLNSRQRVLDLNVGLVFSFLCGAGLTSPGTAATSGLLYSPQ
jgi:hypothetical protein